MTKRSDALDWCPRLPRRREGSVYLAVADALARDIATGRLAPGARLPSQRALAARLGVNLTTISRAFDEARRRGLVVGRAGHGTVVTGRPARDVPSQPLARGARATEAPDAFVDLTFNAPAAPADARIEERLASTLSAMARDRSGLRDQTGYQPSGGTVADRRTGARWVAPRGVAAPPARVLVCAGAQHALAVALQTLARPGDTVLCEALTYPTFRALAAVHGVRLVPVAMDADGLDPDALDRACATRRAAALFCVPTAHNPTATVMPSSRRHEIAAVLRRHALPVIEDDIYAPLLPGAPPALTALVPELAWYVSGVSKALTPGLRTGYLVAPSDAGAMGATSALRTSMWMASPLDAAVVSRWVADGTAARITRALREEAALRHALARTVLARHGTRAPRDATRALVKPASAVWHLWLSLPDGMPRGPFVEAARRRGVGVMAADVFTVPDADAPAESRVPDAVRLCLGGATDLSALRRGLGVIRELLERPHESQLTFV